MSLRDNPPSMKIRARWAYRSTQLAWDEGRSSLEHESPLTSRNARVLSLLAILVDVIVRVLSAVQNVHLRKWQDVLFPFLQTLIEGQTSFRHSCSREGQRDAQYRVGAKFGLVGCVGCAIVITQDLDRDTVAGGPTLRQGTAA